MNRAHSARINGHDYYVYLKDALERLPSHPAGASQSCSPSLAARWRTSLKAPAIVKTGSPDG
jgi:hypothetical protein